MIIFEVFSIVLLGVLLFWTVYNGSIIYVGIKNKRKQVSPVNKDQMDLPRFSIIVPTKNEDIVIRRCLEGLLEMNYPREKMEIVVVDGNSNDGTVKICSEFLGKYPETCKFIREQTSKGKPAALNLALQYTSGEIVGVFDADSLPEKDVLTKVASHFNDTKVMAIQGRTTSLNEESNALTKVIAVEEKAWFQALLNGREKLQLFVPLTGSC